MEHLKMPLIELHNSLVTKVNEKRSEIHESSTEDKTHLISLVENRERQISGFKNAIDLMDPYTNANEGFEMEHKKISEMIDAIRIH
jgi:hypothetical protein